MRLLSFGTATLPEEGGEHALPVTARSSLLDLPNGSWDQDGQRLVLSVSQISYRALVVGLDIDGQVNTIMKAVGKGRGILKAELRDDGPIMVTYAKMKSVQRLASAATYLDQQPLQITFEQDFPFWIDDRDGWFLDSGHYLDHGDILGGRMYTAALTASPTNFTLTNEGTARDIVGTLTFIPRAASSIANITVSNLANGQSFTWTPPVGSPLGAASQLVIDFLTRTVERDGVNDFAHFAVGDPRQVEFMTLELGDNAITISATIVGTVDMYWQYKRMYL